MNGRQSTVVVAADDDDADSDGGVYVVSQTKSITVEPRSEIDFGYNHHRDGLVVFPGCCLFVCCLSCDCIQPPLTFNFDCSIPAGPEDQTTFSYTPDGNFVNHRQSVTFVVRNGHGSVPLLCWILLIVLLLSIVVSIVVICCVALKQATRKTPVSQRAPRIATHINAFSPSHHVPEMLPKYVASPAQSYSTQKLYQWCQQREAQQYKSLWTVNPENSSE